MQTVCLNNYYECFLTPVSNLKQMKSFRQPGAFELERIAYEFQADVEAGDSIYHNAKIIIPSRPSEQLKSAIARRKRFQAKLRPEEDGTFILGFSE